MSHLQDRRKGWRKFIISRTNPREDGTEEEEEEEEGDEESEEEEEEKPAPSRSFKKNRCISDSEDDDE